MSSANKGTDARLRNAASDLLKGGTLVREPCPKCGGVQVRVGDKIDCINCGNERTSPEPEESKKSVPLTEGAAGSVISSLSAGSSVSATIIANKIEELTIELKDEKDTATQIRKVELLEAYLRILEKMKAFSLK